MMRLPLVLLAATSVNAAALDWTRDPLPQMQALLAAPGLEAPAVPAAVPVAPPSAAPVAQVPLHCRPEVIAAFQEIWRMSGSGRQDYEGAVAIDGPADALTFRYAPITREPLLQHVSVTRGVTLAIAHTHPDIADPRAGPKDNDSPVPNYIISRRALYVTTPGRTRESFVRSDWDKPCR